MFNIQLLKMLLITTIGFIVTAMGCIRTWHLELNNVRDRALLETSMAARSIEKILDNAQSAANQAKILLQKPCTPALKNELSRIAIGIAKIRVINLYNHDRLVCSSFPGFNIRMKDNHYNKLENITLKSSSYITPDESLLIFRTNFMQDSVSVSMATQWISDMLKHYGQSQRLYLRVGNTFLLDTNTILVQSNLANKKVISTISARYPFKVETPDVMNLSFNKFINECLTLLLLSFLLGATITTALWFLFLRHKSMDELLSAAIYRGEIVPWYQPIIDADSLKICGVEVLARWIDLNGKMIRPETFIPVAEKNDLIIPLTRQLLFRVAQELSYTMHDVQSPWTIAFNFTQKHIFEDGFVQECKSFISVFPKDMIRLTVEITEREPILDGGKLKARVDELQKEGIAVALDDFGTGYSNLDYLNVSSFDYLKIDRSFVSHAMKKIHGEKLLCSIITLAKSLQLKIVAEGVETTEQAQWLMRQEVEFFQGYLFSPPLSLSDLLKIRNCCYREEIVNSNR